MRDSDSGDSPVFQASLSKWVIQGSREVVSGAAIRLKYITGEELGFFAESAALLRFLIEVSWTNEPASFVPEKGPSGRRFAKPVVDAR